MNSNRHKTRGLYFEDLEVGQSMVSAGRTITEADIVMFAGLTGDYTQIHTDLEYAKETIFGQRVAHGLLVMSYALGLIARMGFIEGTVIAFREIKSWKFTKPVFIGDTIHVVVEIEQLKAVRRLEGGIVVFDVKVINQNGETTMNGSWTAIIKSKPNNS
ncbi:MAG: MaoC/PaaZ C-terminal domain-containing protein [Anaerolineales bacterium]|jgi:acyl dehydratase